MDDILSGRMLIFDGTTTTFRNIRLRNKRKDCDLCSEKPIITHLIDYEQFCGMRATDKVHIFFSFLFLKSKKEIFEISLHIFIS